MDLVVNNSRWPSKEPRFLEWKYFKLYITKTSTTIAEFYKQNLKRVFRKIFGTMKDEVSTLGHYMMRNLYRIGVGLSVKNPTTHL
jgi:hypothetical protein